MAECRRTALFSALLALYAAVAVPITQAQAATAIKIGRTNTPTITHLPIYVALEAGLFREEGLDASFVVMTQRALVTAGLAGDIDFVPLPRPGAQAALKGASVRFVAGQSVFAPTALIAARGITSLEQLRDRTVGFGELGRSAYEDGEIVLRDRFGLFADKDYRAIAFPGEKDRFAALAAGDIQAGLFSFPMAARAEANGFRRLYRTGVFLPRAEGAIWTRAAFLKSGRETVRRFIRAVARATDVILTDGDTAVAVIEKYLDLYRREETKALWLSVRDTYSADIPPALLNDLFAERLERIRQKGLWPRNRKAPNPEFYIARSLLRDTLSRLRSAQETIGVTAPTR